MDRQNDLPFRSQMSYSVPTTSVEAWENNALIRAAQKESVAESAVAATPTVDTPALSQPNVVMAAQASTSSSPTAQQYPSGTVFYDPVTGAPVSFSYHYNDSVGNVVYPISMWGQYNSGAVPSGSPPPTPTVGGGTQGGTPNNPPVGIYTQSYVFPSAPAGMPLGNQAYTYPNGIVGGIPHAPAGAQPGQYMDMYYPNGLMGGVVEPWVYFGNPAGPIQAAVGATVVDAQTAAGIEYGTKDKPVIPTPPVAKAVDVGGGSIMNIGMDSDGTLNVTTSSNKNEVFPIVDNPSSGAKMRSSKPSGNGVYRAMM